MLSIPVAFLFNIVIGGLLGLVGTADATGVLQSWAAVISKAASDFVAGFIEGFVDRANNVKNRLKDYPPETEPVSGLLRPSGDFVSGNRCL